MNIVPNVARRRVLKIIAATATLSIVPGGALAAPGVDVEDFRQSHGPDDADVINAALASAAKADGAAVVRLESGRRYVIGHTCWIPIRSDVSIDLNGAVLRRVGEGEVSATTLATLPTTDTFLPIVPPRNWRIGDRLFIATRDRSDRNVSRGASTIRRIGKHYVELSAPFGDTIDPQDDGRFPQGSLVCKSFSLIEGPGSFGPKAFVNERVELFGGTIEGNGAEHTVHSWMANMAVYLNGNACSIRDVHFRDMPAECIVGHGLRITDCHFTDLAGSAFHTSVHDDTLAQSSISIFERNIVQRVNLVGNGVMGHSEGAITFSWNGGRIIVAHNEFTGGGAALLGVVGRPEAENTRHDFIITGNLCTGFDKVFSGISHEADRVVVTDNIFVDCGDNGVLFTSLSENPTVVIANNVPAGNTVLVRGELSQDDREILAAQEPG